MSDVTIHDLSNTGQLKKLDICVVRQAVGSYLLGNTFFPV